MCGNPCITRNSNNITKCFRGAGGDFCDSVTAHCLLKPYASTLPVSILLVRVLIRLPPQAAVLTLGLAHGRNDTERKAI